MSRVPGLHSHIRPPWKQAAARGNLHSFFPPSSLKEAVGISSQGCFHRHRPPLHTASPAPAPHHGSTDTGGSLWESRFPGNLMCTVSLPAVTLSRQHGRMLIRRSGGFPGSPRAAIPAGLSPVMLSLVGRFQTHGLQLWKDRLSN